MRAQNGLTPNQILPLTNFCSPFAIALLDAEQGVAWLWAQVASANPLYWGRVGSRTFCYSSPTDLGSAWAGLIIPRHWFSPERYVSPTQHASEQSANSIARFSSMNSGSAAAAGLNFLQPEQQVEFTAKLMCYEEMHKTCTLSPVCRVLGQLWPLFRSPEGGPTASAITDGCHSCGGK